MNAIETQKETLINMLNSSPFSSSSLMGWLIVILLIWMVVSIICNYKKHVFYVLYVLIGFQVFHYLSTTSLIDSLPFLAYFKYDLLTSLAQCFVGTKFADILLSIDAYLLAFEQSIFTK